MPLSYVSVVAVQSPQLGAGSQEAEALRCVLVVASGAA